MTSLVADVAFDLPVYRAFSYRVPPGLALTRGQRVRAPLQGRVRVGVVIAVRRDDAPGGEAIRDAVEPAPLYGAAMLATAERAAAESFASLGATLAALAPPLPRRGPGEAVAAPPEVTAAAPGPIELWIDAGREDRLVAELLHGAGSALVVAPDIAAARRWAERLGAGRLDSGASDDERRDAWFGAARGRPRLVVGTRSALLAPLPPPATVALVDEHDPAHKPPGAPRLHSRDVLARRAAAEGSRLVLLSATPSVESWARADAGEVERPEAAPGPWPEVIAADTRGILRNHPLTLPLTRAIEHASRAGRPLALILARESAALGCDECAEVLRCPDCGIALALSRAARTLACRLCGRAEPLPERCGACGGHRLSPVGWGVERVEASLRKRFPGLAVTRARPTSGAGPVIAPGVRAVIGTVGLLRDVPRGSLGAVGFVALDVLLRQPDFRAGERAFQGLWAAAEAVHPSGRVIAQTRHPEHYAVRAAVRQDRGEFYSHEVKFRAELGYPPFRRLCTVSATAVTDAAARALVEECAAALRGIAGLDVYPPARRGAPTAKRPRWSLLIKGPAELPRLLAGPLAALGPGRRRRGGMLQVEMDPVSWS